MMACRSCGAALTETFLDLGVMPVANAFIPRDRADAMEPTYPLHVRVCSDCRLVQLPAIQTPEAMFGDYIYFSSYAESWLRHADRYAAAMVARLGLGAGSTVVEVASNDGYLLQYFQQRGVAVLGVEPAANVAAVALAKGIATDIAFFGAAAARRLREAGVVPDLMVANNVLAHVPDLDDFVAGFAILMPPHAVLTVEFPHLLTLVQGVQFDTIYHEHLSYLSLQVVRRIFARHGLHVFDVEPLPTHGGSLRVYASLADRPETAAVAATLADEEAAGLEQPATYRRLAARAADAKCSLLGFLLRARADGKRVAGYGAPAKGNTLLNYCGIGPDLLAFTVDRSPHKQGMLLPGSRIPVLPPDALIEARPDYVLVLPWNLAAEITASMAVVRDWGGRFVVPIPTTTVLA